MLADAGATCTLLILPAGVVGWTMLTLSPQAAAMIAVAATKSEERRTLMNYPLEVKSDYTIPRNMRTAGRIGNPQ
jgi:hypothetical protein